MREARLCYGQTMSRRVKIDTTARVEHYIGDAKMGSRLGCILVLWPFFAFLIVLPDAAHIWPRPWTNPLLWLIGSVLLWLVLRWLIDKPIGGLRRWPRFIMYGLLIAASVAVAMQIIRSFYGPNGYVHFIGSTGR